MSDRESIAGMIVLGALGAVLCSLALWREWSPVAWWIGAGIVLIALVVIAWRLGAAHRPLRVAAAGLLGLAVAAVPVLEPVLRPSAEVAWSLEGTERPAAEAPVSGTDIASIILTSDEAGLVRARAADDGSILWEQQSPEWEHYRRAPVDVVGSVVLVGADTLAEPEDELVALDVWTGDQLWSAPANVAPLAHNDSVLVMYAYEEDRGDVHRGLDLGTGETLWTTDGSRGAWRSIPTGTPRAVVPYTDWLVDDTADGAASWAQTQHTVTDLNTGEQHIVTGTAGAWSAGVLGDQLVVQEMLVNPAEVDSGDSVTTKVTAYNLPDGGVDWETEIDLSYGDWSDFIYRRPQLITFDGARLQSSPAEHTIDALDLRDGRLSRFQVPSGGSYGSSGTIHWARDDLALGSASGRLSVIELDSEQVIAIPEDGAPSGRPAATAQLNGTASPAWQEEDEGLFGREYNHLTGLNLSDHTAPEPVELGDLPDGVVDGAYAGHIVLVDSEDIPDAASDEPQERTTAMHVLAPFG